MSKIRRGLAVTVFAAALGASFSTPAYADPIIDACDEDDGHVTVEVLNTEIVQVCFQK